MNPKNAIGQGLLWLVFVVAVLLTGSEVIGLIGVALSLLGAVVFLLLNFRYATKLNRRQRSADRADGDRTVAVWTTAWLALALVLCVISALGWLPTLPWHVAAHGALVILPALLFWGGEAIFLSNLVDWYWIRAWRDGVVVSPPCVRGGTTEWLRWKNVTRAWIAHRWIAAASVFVALLANLSYLWVELQDTAKDSPWVLYLLTIAAPVPLISLVMRGYLKPLYQATLNIFSDVRLVLGDVVQFKYGDSFENGMLHEVSLDQGLKFRSAHGRPIDRPFSDIFELQSIQAPKAFVCSQTLCRSLDGVAFQVQPCEWGERRLGPIPEHAAQSGGTSKKPANRDDRKKVRDRKTSSRFFVW